MKDQTLKLLDGRQLGYRCVGDADGQPLFFFHGTPGSRIALTEIDAIANIPGIRFIMPERPLPTWERLHLKLCLPGSDCNVFAIHAFARKQ